MEHEVHESKKHKSFDWNVVMAATVFLIVGFAVFVIFANYLQVPYTTTEDYIEQIPYTENIVKYVDKPYTSSEIYYEDTITVKKIPLSYKVVNFYETDVCIFATCNRVVLNLENTEDIGGEFSVLFTLSKSTGEILTETQKKYIAPHTTSSFIAGDYKFSIKSSIYKIEPPNKEKLVTEQVAKTKPTIKYQKIPVTEAIVKIKTEQKTQNVTKYRSLWEHLFG